jgi:hypothetical protein
MKDSCPTRKLSALCTSPTDNPQDNVYTRAAAALEKWIREQGTRRGFLGAGKLEDCSAGSAISLASPFRLFGALSGTKSEKLTPLFSNPSALFWEARGCTGIA